MNINILLFFCLFFPISMLVFVFKNQSRLVLISLLLGMFAALYAGEINGLIYDKINIDYYTFVVNISPIVEEVLKVIPIIMIAFFLKKDKQTLFECALAIGVGFATFENVCLLIDSYSSISFNLIMIRSFGAGFMHVVSLFIEGYILLFVREKKILYLTGTIAVLSTSITFHSIYNIMIQSSYPITGLLLPMITYIPLIIIFRNKKNISV